MKKSVRTMYTFDSRIRYSETDCDGRLTMAALLNYFQDASTFQSEDLGVGVSYMKQLGRVWVLSSWQIVVERYPALGERVTVGTVPYDFNRFLGYRNFAMFDESGERLAVANTLWTLLDVETGKPIAASKDMVDLYGSGEKMEMEYAPRKILIPEGGRCEEPIVVKKHHLDTNHHVNNGQYVDIAMAFLPEDFVIGQLRAEYKKQAFLDDIFYPYVVEEESKCVVKLADADGNTYVSVEFLRKEN